MSDQIIKDKQKCSMRYMKRKVAVLTALTKANAGIQVNAGRHFGSHPWGCGVWGSATGTSWAEAPDVAEHPAVHRASH